MQVRRSVLVFMLLALLSVAAFAKDAMAADSAAVEVPWTVKPETPPPLPKCTGSVHLPDQGDVDFLIPPRPSPYFAATKMGMTDQIETFDALAGEVHTKPARIDRIREPVFDPAGDFIAGMTQDSTQDMQIWSVKDQKDVSRIHLAERGFWNAVDFPLPGVLLTYFSAAATGALQLWDIKTGQLVRSIPIANPPDKASVLVSPGGRYAVLANDKVITFYDLQTGVTAGQVQFPVAMEYVREGCSIAFSPDGTELAQFNASYGEIPFMRVIDLRTGRQTCGLVIRLTSPRAAADLSTERFNPDASYHGVQWLADGSGWVIGKQCIVDRVSGHGIFEFPKSESIPRYPIIVLSATQILCPNVKLLPHAPAYNNHVVTIENLTLPKDLPERVANVRAGGDIQDILLPPLTRPVMAGLPPPPATALAGPGPIEALPAAAEAPVAPRPLSLLGTFAGDHPLVFVPAVQQVLVTKSYRITQINGDFTDLTNIVGYSLAHRQLFDFPFPAPCDLLDVSPDGTEFIVRYHRDTGDRIDVCSVAGKGKPITSWIPNAVAVSAANSATPEAFSSGVSAAQFIDNDHVVTQAGHELIVWQVTGCKPVYRMPLASNCQAQLSNGRGFLAIPPPPGPRGHALLFVQALTGAAHGAMRLAFPPSQGQSISFSPDGRSVYVSCDESGSTSLWKYDVATGTGTRVIAAPGNSVAAPVWIKGSYGLAGDWLLDATSGTVVAKVNPIAWSACKPFGFANRLWVLSKSDPKGASLLVPIDFPDKTAAAQLTVAGGAAALQSYALKPGDTVSLNPSIPGASADQLKLVNDKLTARLQTLGIQVADGQPITLVMSYAQGDRAGGRLAAMAGIPFNGTLAFEKNGKSLWQTTWTTELSSFFSNANARGVFANLLHDADVQILIDGIPDKTIPGMIPGEWAGPVADITQPQSVADLLDPSKNDPNRQPAEPVAPTPDKSTRTVAAASETDERAELKALKQIVINTNNLRAAADELASGVVTKKISQTQFIDDVNRLERYENILPTTAKNLRPETTESIKVLKQATTASVTDYRTILKALRLSDATADAATAMQDAVDLYKTEIGPETDFLKQRLTDLQTKYP